ncbi:hypothetical protein B0H67DRAFT_595459 [Lasiosphaeris hirsuta]|uniref:Zn(2)-C6 fungal-type domain-containing protein n=1 Tax=Lasiosphaeris hirsuta TaxID=260670 RepID=A0AA39ZRJ3_9PEZI|nr:hypothetical protein B0H67DRAFT_595459 [Lasiosphaeris hirsuta]
MERQGPGRSAPYGQACMSCFKSKCKCIIRNGIGCERCHRLKKQCSPSDALRRRAADKRQSSNARIAELEGRLDGLVSLLRSRNVLDGDVTAQQQHRYSGVSADSESVLAAQTPPSHDGVSTKGAEDEVMSGAESVRDGEEGEEEEDDGTSTVRPPWAANSPQPNNVPHAHTSTSLHGPAIASGPESSASSDSAYLDTFRSQMLHHFPLVYLSPEVTVQQLQQSRPFLFHAIICVASLSGVNGERATKLRRMFCETVISHEEQRLETWSSDTDHTVDLLLGILTYIAWSWDYMLNRFNPALLITLATSLVCEIHLDRSVPQDQHIVGLFSPSLQHANSNVNSEQGYLDRQRAVLACFVLSSALSASFPHIHALQWTRQMGEDLVALASDTGCSADAILVLQVRLQLVISRSLPSIGLEHQLRKDEADSRIKASLEQLQDLRASAVMTSRDHQETGVLLASTSYVELRVLQINHPETNLDKGTYTSGSSRAPPTNASHSLHLWKALLAIESCTSALLALPLKEFLGISFIQWAQLTQCLVALSYLDALQDPGWDLRAVRGLIDLPILLDRMAAKFETASMEVFGTAHQDSSIFANFANKTRVACSDMQTSRVRPETGLEEGKLGDSSMQNSYVTNSTPTKGNAGYWRDGAPRRKYRFWMEQIFDGPA